MTTAVRRVWKRVLIGRVVLSGGRPYTGDHRRIAIVVVAEGGGLSIQRYPTGVEGDAGVKHSDPRAEGGGFERNDGPCYRVAVAGLGLKRAAS